MADEYGDKLVGIEAGAGLTKITQEEVIPTYGLEGMDYSISSTPAMLAERSRARPDAGENIAVTLWHPHLAYDEFPVRDLEDPEGALGEAEKIHMWGSSDFEGALPDADQAPRRSSLTDEHLFFWLENMMFNSDEYADEGEAVQAWLEANPTFVDDLKESAGV